MTSHSTMPEQPQSETETAVRQFDRLPTLAAGPQLSSTQMQQLGADGQPIGP
jgi:hypothetical protein